VPISAGKVADAFTTPLGAGIVVGLVAGKLVGITAFAWLATRLRLGALPEGAGWPGVVSVSAVAGIGFTVSVFVAGLAFDDAPDLQDGAKVAILVASVLAGMLGAGLVAATQGRRRRVPSRH
jgi:Na+:H+ antiporter, NhaA family